MEDGHPAPNLPTAISTDAGADEAYLAPASAPAVIPPQAERDEQLLALWLFDLPEQKVRLRWRHARLPRPHRQGIRATQLGDVQGFVATIADVKR